MKNDETLDMTIEEEVGHNTVERFKGCFWSIFAKELIAQNSNIQQLNELANNMENIFRAEPREKEVGGAYQDALNEFLTEVRIEISELES